MGIVSFHVDMDPKDEWDECENEIADGQESERKERKELTRG